MVVGNSIFLAKNSTGALHSLGVNTDRAYILGVRTDLLLKMQQAERSHFEFFEAIWNHFFQNEMTGTI